MAAPLTPAEFAHLESGLPSTIPLSMLDGYLAAGASGPHFVMPDQVLQWVRADALPVDKTVANLIMRHYQAVNDALNDQIYEPVLTDPQPWCRGYLAGFAADMMSWAPLTAAQPELLKVIMSGAGEEGLADAARRIHAFWVQQRRHGVGGGGVLAQLAALMPGHVASSDQPLH
jgi:yecA family protein